MLGNHPQPAYERVHAFLSPFLDTLSPPKVSACTIQCTWNHVGVDLHRIPSNANICNEREIFPSLGVHYNVDGRHIHCSFSTNGKVIVTGVLSIPEAEHFVLLCLKDYIFPNYDPLA